MPPGKNGMDNSEVTIVCRALDGFGFGAADFSGGCWNTVIGKALAQFRERTGIMDPSISTRNLIARIVEEKLMSELESRAEWLTDLDSLRSGDTIKCKVEGRKLHGRVSLSPKELSVTLVPPSGRDDVRKARLHPLSGESYTQEPYEGSTASACGKARAKRLLLSMADILWNK